VLVPQEAVNELQGTRLIAVVDGRDKVNIRPVQLGDTVGKDWIVLKGVQAGDRVVVEGLQKIRQGMQVSPKPFATR
jgi:membrane fusion protein (multidrug efflux system)